MRYEIHVADRLDPRWSNRFDGMRVHAGRDGAVISGPVRDQAALHGLLACVRDLGLTLVRVIPTDPSEDTR